MRVIAGSAKGLRLYSDPALPTRPLMDRIKESVFNILDEEVHGARVLDLFAGIGTFGIEALSRGAAAAVFVEADGKAASCIEKNLRKGRFDGKGAVVRGTAERFLDTTRDTFNLVFVDPPFADFSAVITGLARQLSARGLVAEQGRLLVRHFYKDGCELEGFERVREKRYGENIVAFHTPRK